MTTRTNVKHFSNRLEIIFWSVVIPRMHRAKFLFQWLSQMKGEKRWGYLLMVAAVCACLGLLTGFFVGSLYGM